MRDGCCNCLGLLKICRMQLLMWPVCKRVHARSHCVTPALCTSKTRVLQEIWSTVSATKQGYRHCWPGSLAHGTSQDVKQQHLRNNFDRGWWEHFLITHSLPSGNLDARHVLQWWSLKGTMAHGTKTLATAMKCPVSYGRHCQHITCCSQCVALHKQVEMHQVHSCAECR